MIFQCVWRETNELFGCLTPQIALRLQQFCSNALTIGTIIYDKLNIYVFTKQIVYVFCIKNTKTSQTDNVNDWAFTQLESVLISKELLKTWKNFNPNLGRFFAIDNHLCNILDDIKYNCWLPNGKHYIIEQIMEEYEIIDEMDGDRSHSGALISADKVGKYAKVMGTHVCYYLILNNKCFQIGECVPVVRDKYNFPPNIIAAVKTNQDIWYYFNANGKHCERPEGEYSDVIDLSLNKIVVRFSFMSSFNDSIEFN
jgi:hypothetical protein